jgi:hypothetical protein
MSESFDEQDTVQPGSQKIVQPGSQLAEQYLELLAQTGSRGEGLEKTKNSISDGKFSVKYVQKRITELTQLISQLNSK